MDVVCLDTAAPGSAGSRASDVPARVSAATHDGVVAFKACPRPIVGTEAILGPLWCTFSPRLREEPRAEAEAELTITKSSLKLTGTTSRFYLEAVLVPRAFVDWQGSTGLVVHGAWPPPDFELTFIEPAQAAQVVRELEARVEAVARSLFVAPLADASLVSTAAHLVSAGASRVLAEALVLYTPPAYTRNGSGERIASDATNSQIVSGSRRDDPVFELRIAHLCLGENQYSSIVEGAADTKALSWHTVRIYAEKEPFEIVVVIALGLGNVCFERGSRSLSIEDRGMLYHLAFPCAREAALWANLLRDVAAIPAFPSADGPPIQGSVIETLVSRGAELTAVALARSAIALPSDNNSAICDDAGCPLLAAAPSAAPWAPPDVAGDNGLTHSHRRDRGGGSQFDIAAILNESAGRSPPSLHLAGDGNGTCCVTNLNEAQFPRPSDTCIVAMVTAI